MSVKQELPLLRSDLRLVKKSGREATAGGYIKDDLTGEVFDFEEEECFILKRLDGKTTLPSIMTSFRDRFGLELEAEQLRAFVFQLYELKLLELHAGKEHFSFVSKLRLNYPPSWKRWRIYSSGRPVKWLATNMRWCYTKGFVFMATIILLLSLGTLYHNFNRFLFEFQQSFVPLSIFHIIVVIYFCFSIPSQTLKAVTAVHYGGRFSEFGLQLNFDILPLFYSENTIGLISDKSGRAWVLFTPILYSLLMSSLGMLCWIMTPGGNALHDFGLILFVVGTLFSLIRLNVFWPVDATYLFANWLDIPDIRSRSILFTKSWLLHHSLSEPLTARERGIFKWFGPLSGGITLVSFFVGFYYLGKLLVYYIGGFGALILLILFTLRYRKVLAEFI